MLDQIKNIASWAGSVVTISAALSLILKPVRNWLKGFIRKLCGFTDLENEVKNLKEANEGMKSDNDKLHTKIDDITAKLDNLIQMTSDQKQASCDTLRGMMLDIYYRYLPYKAMPLYEHEQFSKLSEDYEHNGGNSFMSETVIPCVKKWSIVDDPDYYK